MISYSLKQLVSNKTRVLSTTFAVVISVAFVAAAFILGDGYGRNFTGWIDGTTEGADLVISRETPFDATGGVPTISPDRIDDATLAQVQSSDGVADARPVVWVDNLIRPELPNGELMPDIFWVSTYGWADGGVLSITEGAAPEAGEFVADIDTASDHGYVVGQEYNLSTPAGTRPMTLSGLMKRGKNNDVSGQVALAVQMDEFQSDFDRPGYINLHVSVAGGPDEVEQVRNQLQQMLSDGFEVQTAEETQQDLYDLFSPFILAAKFGFLGFAAIAVFVSAFSIYNTFTILLSQRTREIGLLRALGASSKQIHRSVQTEAAILGFVASVIGIGLGYAVAYGLQALLHASGGLPRITPILSPFHVVICLLVGVIVTLFAASIPARKACRIPPIAALRSGLTTEKTSPRRRFLVGAGFTAVGTILLILGLAGVGAVSATIASLGIGAMLIFIGVALVMPLWITHAISIVGSPLRRLGIPGQIAQDNAARNARRSATNAASLMIGLALVSMVLVIGQSAKVTVADGADRAFMSDYVVASQLGYKYPPNIAEELQALDEVANTVTLSFDTADVNGEVQPITVGSQQQVSKLIDFELSEGDPFSSSVQHPVLVTEKEAEEQGLSVGDTVPVTFINTEQRQLTVVGIHKNNTAGGNAYYLDRSTWFEATEQTTVDIIAIESLSGPNSTLRQEFEAFEQTNAQVTIQTVDEYVEATGNTIDQMLGVLNLMVALAVLVSILGIANTMALSVFERGREIGLLRAVGMHRRQLRRMIRYEAVLISVVGALAGVAIGLGFGAASVLAIPSWIADSVAIPVMPIMVIVLFASFAGMAAAATPAWRASTRKALDLIAGR